MIGFILAQCVSTAVNVLVQAGAFYWQALHAGGTFDQRPAFPWNSFTISLVSALLYLVPAYLLIRWLYYPPSVESEADGAKETNRRRRAGSNYESEGNARAFRIFGGSGVCRRVALRWISIVRAQFAIAPERARDFPDPQELSGHRSQRNRFRLDCSGFERHRRSAPHRRGTRAGRMAPVRFLDFQRNNRATASPRHRRGL